jgi:hypothetical protein
MNLRSLFVIAVLSISTCAGAKDGQAGGLLIGPSFARASMPGQGSGAIYLSLENKSGAEDALVAATTPAAKEVEMHEMSMEGDVMRMRQVQRIVLAPGTQLTMQPGKGYHLMLTGLKAPLKSGDKVPLTLRFQRAGIVQTSISVEDNAGSGMTMSKP